jgi:hypothetical protein
MSERPDWLPALIPLKDHGGDWQAYFDAVYAVFHKDFVDSTPSFRGAPVRVKRHPIEQGRERGFWHVTSEGWQETKRVPDLRRCERIGWIRAIIENAEGSDVRVWDNRRRGRHRAVLWVEGAEFLVVLERRSFGWLLWTAYCVTEEHRKRKLLREYEEAQKS